MRTKLLTINKQNLLITAHSRFMTQSHVATHNQMREREKETPLTWSHVPLTSSSGAASRNCKEKYKKILTVIYFIGSFPQGRQKYVTSEQHCCTITSFSQLVGWTNNHNTKQQNSLLGVVVGLLAQAVVAPHAVNIARERGEVGAWNLEGHN